MIHRRQPHTPLDVPADLPIGAAHRSTTVIDGTTFERFVVRTPWLKPGTVLVRVLEQHLKPLSEPGDLLIVTEKVVIAASGRGVPASNVRPGRLARFLAARVQPIQGSRGLSIPEKMQLVAHTVGTGRVLVAAVAGALTRPFGLHGVFYLIAGRFARDLDGMRPPYEDVLLPPLSSEEAHGLVERLTCDLGVPVAIVDINDRGGSIRAITGSGISADLLRRILHDNPLGQRTQSTPMGLVRRRPERSSGSQEPGASGMTVSAGKARAKDAPQEGSGLDLREARSRPLDHPAARMKRHAVGGVEPSRALALATTARD